MQILLNFFLNARSFPSIILFFSLTQTLGIQPAALVAAVYAVYYTLLAVGAKQVTKLDYAMIAFWGAGLAVARLYPEGADWYFRQNFTSILYFTFFLATTLPFAFGAEPFTTAFAKRKTAPELWNTEQFLTINRIMTLCWAALFFSATLISLAPSLWSKVVLPAAILLFIGIPLNKKFPGYYLNKSGNNSIADENHKNPSLNIVSPGPKITSFGSRENNDEHRRLVAVNQGAIKKAVILFGSPRGKNGHTYRLLERFMAGMAAGGIEYEFISLREKKIKPCTGCFTCWTKTPGVCIHIDDMAELLEKMKRADLAVYAQPLYTFSVPGIMKNFLDRSLPKLEPYLQQRPGGSTRHPLRWRENNPERLVLFSVCGFPEADHFIPLKLMYQDIAKSSGAEIVGEIFRPASESLIFQERFKDKYNHLLEQLYNAGMQLARQGFVSKETETAIARPFFHSVENFRQVANQSWDTLIEYEEKKRRGESVPPQEEYMLNHPRMLFAGMASMYDAGKCDGLEGVLQFEITDRDEGLYHLEISADKCLFKIGQARQPDLKITTPWEIWRRIIHNEISGQEAYQQGLYQAEGDLSLLLRLRAALL